MAALTQVSLVVGTVLVLAAFIWAAQRRNFVVLGVLTSALLWFLTREFIFSDENWSLFAPINWSVEEVVGFLIFAAVIAVLTVILVFRGVVVLARVLAVGALLLVVAAPIITWDLTPEPSNAVAQEEQEQDDQDAGEEDEEPGLEQPPVEIDTETIAKELSDIYQGFGPDDLAIGGDEPIPASAEERSTTASFTEDTIRTREDLINFLNSDHEKAQPARQRVEQALKKAGYGADEVAEAFSNGNRWVWVAPTVESQILGTTYLVDGKVVKAENWRSVAPNDAIWFYVTTDSHIVAEASVRADCGNPEVEKVRKPPPGEQPPPPIEEVPKPKCFDDEGRPVFEGEFCGTPDSGEEQQAVQENDPEHTAPTNDQPSGHTEEVVSEQETVSETGSGADDSTAESPSEDASDNPEYDGSEPTAEGSEGVSDDSNEESTQTELSDDGNAEEESDTNDDTTDNNSGDEEGSGNDSDDGASDGVDEDNRP